MAGREKKEAKLDEIDRCIVECMRENSRVTMKEIGSRVFLSAQAVRNRVERLEDLGILQRYTVNVNCSVFGYRVHALVRGQFSQSDCAFFVGLCTQGKCRILHSYRLTGSRSTFFDIHFLNMEVMRNILGKMEERVPLQVDIVLEESSLPELNA